MLRNSYKPVWHRNPIIIDVQIQLYVITKYCGVIAVLSVLDDSTVGWLLRHNGRTANDCVPKFGNHTEVISRNEVHPASKYYFEAITIGFRFLRAKILFSSASARDPSVTLTS